MLRPPVYVWVARIMVGLTFIVAAAAFGWAHQAGRRGAVDQAGAPTPAVAPASKVAPTGGGQRVALGPPVNSAPPGAIAVMAPAPTQIAAAGLFSWPLLGQITSPFGPRWGSFHGGIDLAASTGDPIHAARAGEVITAGTLPDYGLAVILRHKDGSRTLYAHCSHLNVKTGQQVAEGDVIALVGSTGKSTGPHLHFEIILNDKNQDPLKFLPRR